MRSTLIASLLLAAPALLHAAEPRAMVAAAGSPVPSVVIHGVAPLRISTGVTPPAIAHQVQFLFTDRALELAVSNEVDVKLTVDEKGAPQNIQLVKSAGADLDASVLAAVRQYQFRPAQLDQQPIAMQMNLHIIFQK